MDRSLLKIGEVSDRVGLSLRTIRFYEEAGLVVPETRSAGGFRLYAETAVARLLLIKEMKPLGFSVEEMVEVLGDLDAMADPGTSRHDAAELAARLDAVRERVQVRAAELLETAARAHDFAVRLGEVADPHR
ncbi:MAG: MerR family transcriptional regulator [Marmoricola sp.]